jgi:hypothetical protein
MTLREKIEKDNPDALFLSQYGDALVGMTLGDHPVAVYDFDLMVARFRKLDWSTEKTRDEAEKCIVRNFRAVYPEPNFPVILRRNVPEHEDE